MVATLRLPPRSPAELPADEHGASTLLVALSLSAMLGFVALGLNAAGGLAEARDLQRVADLAAEAGARALRSGRPPVPQAKAVVREHLAMHDVRVTVEAPPGRGRKAGAPEAVAVELARKRPILLGSLLGAGDADVAARAVASVETLGPGCLLALDPDRDAILDPGRQLHLEGCHALAAATGVPAARLAQASPYAVPADSPVACVPGTLTVAGTLLVRNGAIPQAACGGVRVVAGGRLRVEGLTWRLAGPLVVEAGGTLETSAATLWSGRHAVQFLPGARVTLSPPAHGGLAGIAILGAATGPSATSRLVAGSGQLLTGAILLPTQTVELAGNGAACTQLVAQRIAATGPTRLGHACTGVGVKTIGDRRVALVE